MHKKIGLALGSGGVKGIAHIGVIKTKDMLYALLDLTLKGGIVKGEKKEKLMDEWFDDADFSDLKITFSCGAVDLVSGQPVVYTQDKIRPAVRASISIPSLFRPVKNGRKMIVDGAFCNHNIPKISARSFDIMRHYLAEHSMRSADVSPGSKRANWQHKKFIE